MQPAVLTVSSSRTLAIDASGDLLEELLRDAGAASCTRELTGDDSAAIEAVLRRLAGEHDLILTTGGTGLTADDVTPEATLAAVEREVPGIAEAMRRETAQHTPMAALSRATAGTLGRTLIVNFPGSQKGCEQCFEALRPVLAHALELLSGEQRSH